MENITDDNKFKALYYQDAEICLVYQAYAELIMVDATYKLLNLRYLLLCIDGNGQGEIVSM